MSRPSILILLGILTMLAPFSGLPSSIRTFFVILFGAAVAGIGIALRAERVEQALRESRRRVEDHELPTLELPPEPPAPPTISNV